MSSKVWEHGMCAINLYEANSKLPTSAKELPRVSANAKGVGIPHRCAPATDVKPLGSTLSCLSLLPFPVIFSFHLSECNRLLKCRMFLIRCDTPGQASTSTTHLTRME